MYFTRHANRIWVWVAILVWHSTGRAPRGQRWLPVAQPLVFAAKGNSRRRLFQCARKRNVLKPGSGRLVRSGGLSGGYHSAPRSFDKDFAGTTPVILVSGN